MAIAQRFASCAPPIAPRGNLVSGARVRAEIFHRSRELRMQAAAVRETARSIIPYGLSPLLPTPPFSTSHHPKHFFRSGPSEPQAPRLDQRTPNLLEGNTRECARVAAGSIQADVTVAGRNHHDRLRPSEEVPPANRTRRFGWIPNSSTPASARSSRPPGQGNRPRCRGRLLFNMRPP